MAKLRVPLQPSREVGTPEVGRTSHHRPARGVLNRLCMAVTATGKLRVFSGLGRDCQSRITMESRYRQFSAKSARNLGPESALSRRVE